MFSKWFNFLRVFFPIQLIFGHLKYNLFALFFWIIFFLIISDGIGYAYGIPFLFYSPEYHGEIGYLSFMFVGFSFGGFTTAFNTYSYMKLGRKYPFLATLSRPFIQFSLNNALIPFVFNCYFIYRFVAFQRTEEFADSIEVLIYILAYIIGFLLFQIITLLYFFPVNRNVFKILGVLKKELEIEDIKNSFIHPKIDWSTYFKYQKDREYIYMSSLFSWRKSRSINHYDKELLNKVLAKTRINSSFFEIVTILSFVLLGVLRDTPIFEVPAAMSFVLFLTIILMLYSAFRSWFGYWTNIVLIVIILAMNYMSINYNVFQYKSYAYGLNYDESKLVPFNVENITERNLEDKHISTSKDDYLKVLESWRTKTGKKKPKLIIISTTGGGSRSAMWTFSVLHQVYKKMPDSFMKHVHLITGASGGMIGASYFRALYFNDKFKNKGILRSDLCQQDIGKDLLNKLIFSAYSNDLFFRGDFKFLGQTYSKDRGYAFEQQLHSNTNHALDVPLSYYSKLEKKADIPTMIFTPTVIDNGRRLLISCHSLAFMCKGKANTISNGLINSFENIDFRSFFKDNSIDSLRFSSVLRMNATFPFVLPMVSMPCQPDMHIMDAGLRDNYGGKISMEFLYSMRTWLKKNTSGVIIVQVRDTKKLLRGDVVKTVSLLEKFRLPFGNMYNNFPRTQDYDQELLLKVGTNNLGFKVNYVSFNLLEEQKKRISLSWHLTSQEKARVKKAFYSRGNKFAMYELTRLMRDEE